MRQTILVTGGAGFIGSHLCEALLKRGDRVVALDNFNRYYSPRRKRANLSWCHTQERFELIEGDIRDKGTLALVFERFRFDTVVHLAAMAGVRPSIENPALYAEVNVVGTTLLLEEVRKSAVPQFIFASSSSVYGNRTQGPFCETDATDNQISPYGATKKAGELVCATFAHLYGIQTSCLRFFTVYGPRNRPDMANYLFINALLENKPIMQFGDGHTGRDYTYVADTVAGIMAAIDHPNRFEIVNLGNSQPVRLRELIDVMERVTGKKAHINTLPLQQGDVELTFADTTKAKQLWGWQAKTPIEVGVTQLYQWMLKTSHS
jgi:UDP-glucuronate 4-epimerase